MASKSDLISSAFGVIVLIVTALVILANCCILLTIRKTLQFSASIKLHLGLIAICDIVAAVLLCIKYELDISEKRETLTCKIIIGCVLVPSVASLLTNVSMCLECITLLNRNVKRYGCFELQSKQLTSRGWVILVTCTVLALIPPSGVIFPVAADSNDTFRCVLVYPHVYHPLVLKLWAIIALLLCAANILLMALVVYRLKHFFNKSNAIHTVVSVTISLSKTASANQASDADKTTTTNASERDKLRDTKSSDSQSVTSESCSTGSDDAKPPVTLKLTQLKPPLARQKSVSAAQQRLLVFMVTATMFFTACYIPYAGAVFMYTFCPGHCGISPDVINFAATSLVFHGLFNIIVYTVKNKDFRQNLKAKIVCSRR